MQIFSLAWGPKPGVSKSGSLFGFPENALQRLLQTNSCLVGGRQQLFRFTRFSDIIKAPLPPRSNQLLRPLFFLKEHWLLQAGLYSFNPQILLNPPKPKTKLELYLQKIT